jgi:hypothetical protein
VLPGRLLLYSQRHEYTAEGLAMKVERLASAPECGRNHHTPALDNEAHMAQKDLVENRLNGCLIIPPKLKPAVTPARGGGSWPFIC